ncbi:hypothetical protein FB451DRAFT_1182927 [Mycena latifolia]|nr:hypothetical protein FB451DRAFT_1182927 [Mycena latifolia]
MLLPLASLPVNLNLALLAALLTHSASAWDYPCAGLDRTCNAPYRCCEGLVCNPFPDDPFHGGPKGNEKEVVLGLVSDGQEERRGFERNHVLRISLGSEAGESTAVGEPEGLRMSAILSPGGGRAHLLGERTTLLRQWRRAHRPAWHEIQLKHRHYYHREYDDNPDEDDRIYDHCNDGVDRQRWCPLGRSYSDARNGMHSAAYLESLAMVDGIFKFTDGEVVWVGLEEIPHETYYFLDWGKTRVNRRQKKSTCRESGEVRQGAEVPASANAEQCRVPHLLLK